MSKSLSKFTVILSTITLVVLMVGGVLFWKIIPQYYITILPFMLLFFFVVTFVSFWIGLRLLQADIGKFTRYSMVITFAKLFIYLIFGISYMLNNSNKLSLITFVICLFILYLIYTIAEVTYLSKLARNKSK